MDSSSEDSEGDDVLDICADGEFYFDDVEEEKEEKPAAQPSIPSESETDAEETQSVPVNVPTGRASPVRISTPNQETATESRKEVNKPLGNRSLVHQNSAPSAIPSGSQVPHHQGLFYFQIAEID